MNNAYFKGSKKTCGEGMHVYGLDGGDRFMSTYSSQPLKYMVFKMSIKNVFVLSKK
jgi:hypothetical protein